MKRHNEALLINNGACNPPGVARSLVEAIDEARHTGGDCRNDPAVQLIIHQLAFICGLGDVCCSAWEGWNAAIAACQAETKGARATIEVGSLLPAGDAA